MFNTENLKKLFKENSLNHAYIFFGDNHHELKKQALDLASFIEDNKNLSDTYILQPKEDENSIGIERVREAKTFLYIKPLINSKRILIIEEGESLTTESQNALLKIIEEAPKFSLIIILVKHKSLLLETIISRAQSIFIENKNKPILSDKEIKEVKEFLSREYSKDFLKNIADHNTKKFLQNVINYLSLDIKNNYSKINKVLNINTRVNELSVNKKLQLEALSEELKKV